MKRTELRGNYAGVSMGAYLYAPAHTDGKPLPLIIFLHGSGERGDGSTEQLPLVCTHGIPRYIRDEEQEYPAFILCPQCPAEYVWNNVVISLKALLDEVLGSYPIDPKRISVTGLSMGGFGTFELAMTYPQLFSAIAPVCGGGSSWRTRQLLNVPIWAFHGDSDSVVPVSYSTDMIDTATRFGCNAKLTLFHKVDHPSWDPAYRDTKVIEWLLSSVKQD